VGDLGWYNIRFTLWALNWKLPAKVQARTLAQAGQQTGSANVPTEFTAELYFDDNISAGFYCGFETANQQTLTVSGSHGYVQLDDFVLPFLGDRNSFESVQSQFVVKNCQFEMRTREQGYTVLEASNNAVDAQETNMVRTFSQLVLSEQIDQSWFSIARKTQLVCDACIQSAASGSQLVEVAR
jgi:predicted dehydrogenase